VIVDPPTVEETVEILKGLRKKYEDHHRVSIPDPSLRSAAELSDRYITDRFLPDKAIDVIDEAGARARLASQAPPAEIGQLKADLEKVNRRKRPRSGTRISSGPPRCGTASGTCRTGSGFARKSGSGSGRPSVRSSAKKRSRSSSPAGPAFRSPGSRKRRPRGCSGWRTRSTSR
jgi:ATP-dependent Clp protease ATP-binding subunit ClpA